MIDLISDWNPLSDWSRARKDRRRKRRQDPLCDVDGFPLDMDAGVVDTIQRVQPFTMTTTDRLNGLCEAVRYLVSAGIEGDIVECGVWKGGSMMAVAESLVRFGDTSRQLHLYDTFTGMSEPTGKDVSLVGEDAVQRFHDEKSDDPNAAWCGSSLDRVKSHMAQTGYPDENMNFVVGKVEDTIPHAAPQEIALLRLDTDWYESTLHEMNHLFPRLVDGGVLILDDYGHWQGAREAVDEYLSQNNVSIMLNRLDYTGRIGIKHAGHQLVRFIKPDPGNRHAMA